MDADRHPEEGNGPPAVPPYVDSHKGEKRTPQKWVQCTLCKKWRKVPYRLRDSDLGDSWECRENIWEPYYANCRMRQALSNDQIDAILGSCQEVEENSEMHISSHQAYPSPEYRIRSSQHEKRKGSIDRTELSDVAEAMLKLGGDSGALTGSGSTSKNHLPPLVPGRIIWGKVEGHDWWPCKVVRRRSVPSEVGPPPGGPVEVMYYTPVVFFTPSGIPKEIEVSMGCEEFPITICQRACGLIGTSHGISLGSGVTLFMVEEDEAEYAWLSADNIRVFCHGDVTGRKDGQPVDDDQLKQCITAAQTDLSISDVQIQKWDDAEDSDGGWCCTADFQRNRHMRNKKTNRRKLKRMDEGGSDMESGQDDGPELIPYGGFRLAPKIAVEHIYAWRRPLSREERAKELEKENEEKAMNLRKLAFLEGALMRKESLTSSLFDAYDFHERIPELQTAPSMSFLDQSDLVQQEREAVSTLLGLGPLSEIDGESELPSLEEAEYFVKYANRSHMHNEWGKESTLMKFAKRKLMQFKRRHCDEPINMFNKDWAKPERIISRRKCRTGPGWELLIKWCDLGYEYCTWESENARILSNAETVLLYIDLWKRQRNAVDKKSKQAIEQYHETRARLFGNYKPLDGLPEWIRGGQLLPGQLEVLDWLRSLWLHDKGGVLIGDAGQGRTAATAAFLNCLKEEMHCIRPFLIVIPGNRMSKWDGEIDYWTEGSLYTAQYQGPPSARPMCLEYEIWQYMESMDDRNPCRDTRKIPKPDAVLVSSDVFPSERENLMEVPWNVAILDTRGLAKGSMQRLAIAMSSIKCPHFVIASELPSSEIGLTNTLRLVDPRHPGTIEVQEGTGDNEKDDRIAEQLQTLLKNHVLRIGHPIRPLPEQCFTEIWIPLESKPAQKDQCKESLVKSYEFLKDEVTHRFSAQNVGTLKMITEELSLICFHPALADDNEDFDSVEVPDMISQSGKFEALAVLLHELKQSHIHTLLLTQRHKTLSLLLKFVTDKFGQEAVESIFPSESTAMQHRTVQRFVGGEATFLLTTGESCGLGMRLDKVGCAVIVESSLKADDDLVAFSQTYQIGTRDEFPVFRLYLAATVEERMLHTIRKSDSLALSNLSRGNSYDMKAFEDVLVWGTQNLFANERELQRHPVLHSAPSRTATCTLDATTCKTMIAAGVTTVPSGQEGDFGTDIPGVRWRRRTRLNTSHNDYDGVDVPGLMIHHVTDPLLIAGYWEQLLRREWEEKRQLENVREHAKRIAIQQERYELMEYEMEKEGSGQEGQEAMTKPPLKRKQMRKRFSQENEPYVATKGQKKQRSVNARHDTGALSQTEDRQNDENQWTKEALESCKAHQDVFGQILTDPNTAEGKAAMEAVHRIDRFAKELSLPTNIILMARHVAQTLLSMKEEKDLGLYFHDYTILAVIAYAAYLGRFDLGEQCGLKTLAAQYNQDLSVMDKLFSYITKLMLEHKQMLIKVNQLVKNGVYPPFAETTQGETKGMQGRVAEAKKMPSAEEGASQSMMTSQSLHRDLDTFLKNLSEAVHKSREIEMEPELLQLPADTLEQPPGAPIKGYQPTERFFPQQLIAASPILAKKARKCEAEMFVIEKLHDTQFKAIGKHFQQFQERVRDCALRTLEKLDLETTAAKKHVEEVQQQLRQSVRAMTQQPKPQTPSTGDRMETLFTEFQAQNQWQQNSQEQQPQPPPPQSPTVHAQQSSAIRSTDLHDHSPPASTRETNTGTDFQTTNHGTLDQATCVYNVTSPRQPPPSIDRFLLTIANSTNSVPPAHKPPEISPPPERRSSASKHSVPRVLQYTVPAHPFTMSKTARTAFHNVKLQHPAAFPRSPATEPPQMTPPPFNLQTMNLGQNPYSLYFSNSLPLHSSTTQPLSIQLPNSPGVISSMLPSGSAVCMIQPRLPSTPVQPMNAFSGQHTPQPKGDSVHMAGQYFGTQWSTAPSLRTQQNAPLESSPYMQQQQRHVSPAINESPFERVDSGQSRWSALAVSSTSQMHSDLMPTVTTERPPARSTNFAADVTTLDTSGAARIDKNPPLPSCKATITTGVSKSTNVAQAEQEFSTHQVVYGSGVDPQAVPLVQQMENPKGLPFIMTRISEHDGKIPPPPPPEPLPPVPMDPLNVPESRIEAPPCIVPEAVRAPAVIEAIHTAPISAPSETRPPSAVNVSDAINHVFPEGATSPLTSGTAQRFRQEKDSTTSISFPEELSNLHIPNHNPLDPTSQPQPPTSHPSN